MVGQIKMVAGLLSAIYRFPHVKKRWASESTSGAFTLW